MGLFSVWVNMDFDCIHTELNKIIKNRKRYSSRIILYALAAIELISTKIISNDLIKLLENLKEYLDCYIDFELLTYYVIHKKSITLTERVNRESNDDDLDQEIDNFDDLLKKDMLLFNSIVGNDESNYDEYGEIGCDVINASRELFNLLDQNGDGYISAVDALYISKVNKEHPLILDSNFDDTIIDLLTSDTNVRIDFSLFLTYLI